MSDRRLGFYSLFLGSILLIGGLYLVIICIVYLTSAFDFTGLLLMVGGSLLFIGIILILIGVRILREPPEIYRL